MKAFSANSESSFNLPEKQNLFGLKEREGIKFGLRSGRKETSASPKIAQVNLA